MITVFAWKLTPTPVIGTEYLDEVTGTKYYKEFTVKPPEWVKQSLINIPTKRYLYMMDPIGPKTVSISYSSKPTNGSTEEILTREYKVDSCDPYYVTPLPENCISNFQYGYHDYLYHPKEISLNWSYSYGFITENEVIKEYRPGLDTIDQQYYPKLLDEHKLEEKAAYFHIADKGGHTILAVIDSLWEK